MSTFSGKTSILAVLLFLNSVATAVKSDRFQHFVKDEVCILSDDQLTSDCLKSVENKVRPLECLSTCSDRSACFGVRRHKSQHECVLLQECLVMNFFTKCPDNWMKIDIYRKDNYCFRGGIWQEDRGTCSCVDTGMLGTRCQEFPTTCLDLWRQSDQDERWVFLKISDNLPPVLGHCRRLKAPSLAKNDGPCLDILRNDGGAGHNRSWTDYVSGYYVDQNNFWFGLRNLWIVTRNSAVSLNIYFKFENLFGVAFPDQCLRYLNFSLGSESDGFPLTIGQRVDMVSGNSTIPIFDPGDCLSPYVNVPFSTWDMDVDGIEDRNLASENGAGWWYGNDTECNILGQRSDLAINAPAELFRMPGFHLDKLPYGPAFKRVVVSLRW